MLLAAIPDTSESDGWAPALGNRDGCLDDNDLGYALGICVDGTVQTTVWLDGISDGWLTDGCINGYELGTMEGFDEGIIVGCKVDWLRQKASSRESS